MTILQRNYGVKRKPEKIETVHCVADPHQSVSDHDRDRVLHTLHSKTTLPDRQGGLRFVRQLTGGKGSDAGTLYFSRYLLYSK